MFADISRLFQARDLVHSWTSRILRARYQQSALGGLWMVVQPVATVAMFTVIFTLIVPVDTGTTPYVVFSYVALVPWLLLANSLPDMSNAIVENMQLVSKIYFPREVLLVSVLLARLLDFLIAGSLLIGLILFFGVPIFPPGWLLLPIILGIQLLLLLGLGFGLAACNVFFRDVKPLLTLGIQLWFYASPIIYPVSLVPEQLRPYYFLNPMAGILEAYRAVLLYQTFPGLSLATAGLVAVLIFVGGFWFFKHVEFEFADII